MNKLNYINRASVLTFVTVGLSGLQSYYLHIITSDYAHRYFSIYFYFELFVAVLTLITGLKNGMWALIYLFIFILEVFVFLRTERPYGPDELLMLIVGVIRIYIFIWLVKRLRNSNSEKANT
jgi:hypothetical protein